MTSADAALTDFFATYSESAWGTNYNYDKLWQLWNLSDVLLVLVVAQAILLFLYVVARLNPHRRGLEDPS